METKKALVIVDVQPTFCEGGELGVSGGNEIARKIADFTRQHRSDYEVVVTTQDWHIDPGDHFSEDPDFVDTWPPHGVAGSPNAQLHPEIAALVDDGLVNNEFKKGQYAAAYSGFEGSDEDGANLLGYLQAKGIRQVHVVGIAESHCVAETALDAAPHFEVTVFSDLTVPVSEETAVPARERMKAGGVIQRRVAQ